MLIDWFTVGAQVVNFILLVWLMKRFLYKPILNAIAEREKSIAAKLSDAAATQTKATKQQDELQHKNEIFNEQRTELMQLARESAKNERERLQVETREDADVAADLREKDILAQDQQLRSELIRHTQSQVFDISRLVLRDLASVRIEARMSEVFIQRLKTIDHQVLNNLGAALKSTSSAEPALLLSAFDLPEPQQNAIRSALKESFGQEIPLQFKTNPDLVSGIELSANGIKMTWSISAYLAALSTGLHEQLGVVEQQ